MKKPVLVASAALLTYAAWRYLQTQRSASDSEASAWDDLGGQVLDSADSIVTDVAQGAAEVLDSFTGGILQVSAMSRVPRSVLNDPNVQAFLRVIRAGEGTADEGGYRRLFGGGTFSSFADHPRQLVRKSGYSSTAAGAYQFLASTWDETARIMKLSDFSPASQDYAAVGRIAARGALADVRAGRFDLAIKKVAREWASMPGSPYGQPTITLDRARNIYATAGGDFGTMQA